MVLMRKMLKIMESKLKDRLIRFTVLLVLFFSGVGVGTLLAQLF